MKYTPTFLALGLTIGCLGYAIGFIPTLLITLTIGVLAISMFRFLL